MKFIYGLPAVSVTDPDGEEVLYLIRQVVPDADEQRAYVLVKPSGDENRVSDHGNGRWRCTCKSWLYRDRHSVEKQGRCKHCEALYLAVDAKREQLEAVGAA